MRFGPIKNKVSIAAVFVLSMSAFASCKTEKTSSSIGFKLPEQGKEYTLGQDVRLELDVPTGETVSGVTYMLDQKVLGTQANGQPFTFKTGDLTLGYKLVSAIVSHEAAKDTITVNIVLKSAIKPEIYSYQILNTYPHDTTSYTQGLEYHDGRFLESTGENGQSTLRWVDLKTGKAIKKIDIDQQYFGEGSTLIGNKVVMLTWQNNMGFVYDAATFKQLSTFPYQNSREGWGLTFDGNQLLKSDGTNRIWFLNKESIKEERYIEVFDDKGQVDQLNELEYIDGKLYSNVYQTNKIAIIDPKSGAVESYIDATGILPKSDTYMNTDVLNGIAWDKQGKRLFITGKKWDKLFEIKMVPAKVK
jgi:glutamine cyclotransferase